MPGVFVTATGTDVGKTYVTAGLIHAGRRAGLAMDALKPILTGYAEVQAAGSENEAAGSENEAAGSDAGMLLAALGCAVTPATIARIAPWRFAAPLSPNMAAAAEGRPIDLPAVAAACRAALRPDHLTLIEGIGGVMVPLDSSHTVLDLIADLALPVVLVSGTQLGALSHCLTACTALRTIGRPAALIVLDESPGTSVPLAATRETLAGFNPGTPLVVVPREAGDAIFDGLLQQVLAIV